MPRIEKEGSAKLGEFYAVGRKVAIICTQFAFEVANSRPDPSLLMKLASSLASF